MGAALQNKSPLPEQSEGPKVSAILAPVVWWGLLTVGGKHLKDSNIWDFTFTYRGRKQPLYPAGERVSKRGGLPCSAAATLSHLTGNVWSKGPGDSAWGIGA